MKKLAICVLTANRPDILREGLANVANVTGKLDIPNSIFDGSSDDGKESQKIVEYYNNKGYKNISIDEYRFRAGDEVSDSLRIRIERIFTNTKSEYILMTGDKAFMYESVYERLIQILDKEKPDIVCGFDWYDYKVFDSPVDFLKYCMVGFTYYGRVVIKKDLMKNNIPTKEESNNNPCFYLQNAYLKSIDKTDFKGITMPMKNRRQAFELNQIPNQKWHIWLDMWNTWMKMLPDVYCKIKDDLYGIMDREYGFFSRKELIRLRINNEFDLEEIEKKEEAVKKIIKIDIDDVKKIASCPIANLEKEYAETALNNAEKMELHYRILYVWMRQKNLGGRIESFFEERNYKNVLIYGAGYLGELLCYELNNTSIEIKGVIDKKETQKILDIPVYKPTDVLPDANVMVNTVPFYDEEIKAYMGKKVHIPIHSIMEMISCMNP